MRARLVLFTLLFAFAGGVGVAAFASASSNTLLPPLQLELHAFLSRQGPKVAGLELRGKVSTRDGTHPSALREATIDLGRNGLVNAAGLPICSEARLEEISVAAARRQCRQSIVGSGVAHIELISPSGTQILSTPLGLFNGGVKNGKTTLFIQGSTATSIVAVLEIGEGKTGRHAVLKVPKISEGRGSLVSFDLRVQRAFMYKHRERSYLEAQCTNGRLRVSVPKIVFRNEAHVPSVEPVSVLKSSLIARCLPGG